MDLYKMFIQPFVDYFNEGSFFKNDFAVAGVITATIAFIFMRVKSIPQIIWNRAKRHIFYTVTVEQNDELYNLVCRYLDLNYPNKTRKCQAITKESTSGVYRTPDEKRTGVVSFSPLVDNYFLFRRFLHISKERDKLNNAEDHDMVYFNKITISGVFAKKRIQNFVNECHSLRGTSSDGTFLVKEYHYSRYQNWELKSNSHGTKCSVKKTTDQIFFPEKETILNLVDVFQNSKDRYEKASVDWYMGLLLHGKAGSGKTSFARALAKYSERNLYTLNLGSMDEENFKNAFLEIPEGSLLLLDDVDICINGRDDKDSGVKLSTLLSCLDGNDSKSDLIVVMTTNRIEVLDEALVRKGRVDLIEEVSYPDVKSIREFVEYFYDQELELDIKEGEIDFSMVEVQHLCLNNQDMKACVEKINEKIR